MNPTTTQGGEFPWGLVAALLPGLALLLLYTLGDLDLGSRGGWRSFTHIAFYGGVPVIELGVVALFALASKHRLRNVVIATWIFNVVNFAATFFGVYGAY